jgi:Ser/Thr protein kinase RdoA (MazF antagonist)
MHRPGFGGHAAEAMALRALDGTGGAPRLLDVVDRDGRTGLVLDRLPDGDRVCHGDYHPGNVLLAADRTAVIDWVCAARGAAEADHDRTLLLLRWADPLPGPPLLTRALLATGRALLARRYART